MIGWVIWRWALSRQPLLLLGTVVPVVLAIAVNTALFSLSDGLIYRDIRSAAVLRDVD